MVQDLEKSIADARHALETVAQSRRDTQFELTDFIRTRTELECIIEDLRAAGQNVGGMREDVIIDFNQERLSFCTRFFVCFCRQSKI